MQKFLLQIIMIYTMLDDKPMYSPKAYNIYQLSGVG
jgi:hypothetical protein